ncbi:hypothetical protein DRW48_02900 [Paracoccus suum]|uniref:Uncharacterized protein n=1 Tax=Paracoccus suum TaxID=2259340 RepID=A0A344PHC3_9RHOB|nr:hypothetical protein [Paracoccus suum]AXC48778.1 hypothetical protein DRW48_02900 [Paracoccus suum]
MRDFFITWMERLLGLFVVLSVLGVLTTAYFTAISDRPQALIAAVAVVVAGAVSIILTFGFAYIALGIHANTRRTAEAAEAIARGGSAGRGAPAPQGLVPQAGAAVRRAGPPIVQGPVKPDNLRR